MLLTLRPLVGEQDGDRAAAVQQNPVSSAVPALSEFAALTGTARRAAKHAGLTKADVSKAVRKVRRGK